MGSDEKAFMGYRSMSNYILEYKKNYISNLPGPMKLCEYMMFKHQEDLSKCVVLKFKNQTKETIIEIEFEMIEYDSARNPIQKSTYKIESIYVDANEDIIPYERMKVSDHCESIDVKLVTLVSERGIWANNKWHFYEQVDSSKNDEPQYDLEIKKVNRIVFPFWIHLILLIVYVLLIVTVYFIDN